MFKGILMIWYCYSVFPTQNTEEFGLEGMHIYKKILKIVGFFDVLSRLFVSSVIGAPSLLAFFLILFFSKH